MNPTSRPFIPRQIPGLRYPIIFPEPYAVLYELNYQGLKSSLDPEDIFLLTDSNLRSLFLSLWRGPKKKFIEAYRLVPILFNSFMKRANENLESRSAIQKFLLHTSGSFANLEPDPYTYKSLEELREETESASNSVIRKNVEALVENILLEKDVTSVCFIDGDNCPKTIDSMIGIPRTYVICYLLKDTYPRSVYLWSSSSSFSLRYTLQSSKDASDVLMVMDAVSLHTRLPKELSFIFVTSDGFINELIANLSGPLNLSVGRKKIINIDPKFRNLPLAVCMFNESKLLSGKALTPQGLKDKTEDASFWQENHIFRNLVRNADTTSLQIELMNLGDDLPEKKDLDKLDPRIAWKLAWKGQVKQFIATWCYKITFAEFVDYINGKRELSEAEEAIKKYLMTLYLRRHYVSQDGGEKD